MKKALVVGINEYEKIGCLSCCCRDALIVSELLNSNGNGDPNFEVITIAEKCNKRELEDYVKVLFSDEADVALLYFSGHGCADDGGYLCTSDCGENNIGISMQELIEMVNSSKCRNKIIILDCCFAGKMGESILDEDRSILGDGVTIIAASKPEQTSAERSDIGHGVFTDLLIQGLKGGAADIGGSITPGSLYSFIDQSLGAWQQRPVFKTNISRFLPIRTVEAKVPKEKLRMLIDYFKSPTDEFRLNPSFEFTNRPDYSHQVVEPYADHDKVEIFKNLQLFESVGLIEPVDEEHMYFAAMNSKSCKLTALGLHYWNLAKDKRF